MKSTILAYVIALAGLVMIAAGAWDLFTAVADADETLQVSDYANGFGAIASGLALVGLAQALRLLLEINAKGFSEVINPNANLA